MLSQCGGFALRPMVWHFIPPDPRSSPALLVAEEILEKHWGPKMTTIPAPGTCKHVTFHGKGPSHMGLKLTILGGEVSLDHGPKGITRVLMKGDGRARRRRRRCEDGSRGQRGQKTLHSCP